MSEVILKKPVSGETLESAIFKAAKNLGWNVKKKLDMVTNYRLASVHEEKRVGGVDYRVKCLFLPLFRITFYSGDMSRKESSFVLHAMPLADGFATKKQVVKYLGEVSNILND